MIAMFFFLSVVSALLIFVACELYLIRTSQQSYFKKSTDNWNELITAIKELGRYAE